MADILVINKVDTASPEDIEIVKNNIRKYNPKAKVVEAASPITATDPEVIKGKRVLVVEDGPTITHGGMNYGAGTVAAKKYGAKEIVDPREYAVGSIKDTYEKYTTTGPVLPAMGYGKTQIEELEETINKADVDAVVIGTPIDLGKLIKINKPYIRVIYELYVGNDNTIEEAIKGLFK
ncbi:GTPase, partial [candidate division WOR-3 bacterium]|nr:GTPase [candidate division WOR-3 bacterium]